MATTVHEGPARANMAAQAAETASYDGVALFSLDEMWRACGRPTEKSPRQWLAVVQPLVDAFSRYIADLLGSKERVAVMCELAGGVDALPADAEHSPHHPRRRQYDLMCGPFIAQLYAAFLDEEALI